MRPPAKRRFPIFRVLAALIVLALAAMFEPHCFRFAFERLLRLEAWRCGIDAQMRAVEGSLFDPVTVRDSVWIYESADGPISRLEIKTAHAAFSWRDLFSRGAAPWFQKLTVEGVRGKIELPIETPMPERPGFRIRLPRPQSRWLRGPERIEARDVDFIFQSDGDFVRLEGAQFSVSEVEPGSITVKRLAIKQPWLNRTFHGVHGTTKLDESTVEFAGVALEPGVLIQSLSAEFAQLARGRLNLDLHIAAFGGFIRIETQTLPKDRQLTFEANSQFSRISIGALATFLGLSDATGGTIKVGNFTFRGSPQNPTRATATLRLEATNFQWDSRQWDSLVLGATLMDQRVQIPELTLHQGHNHLTLNGECALPAPKQEWWQSEFAFNVAAKIQNLTELSALMLPEFKYAAGSATIDGAVRGKNQQFDGQIIVAGSSLTWRNAPIDDLHASLKLNGNELQLTNLSIFNDGDYVRGRGVVNSLGDKQYWGELRGSIDDLGKYAALLQKPILPEPLAGGALIDWSGEGSAKGHSGKFFARLRKLRSLGASASLLHPINANLEGTYAPGSMLFSQFALSDDESSFAANVAIGNKALSLQGIRFVHRNVLELEGDALLPLDVWKAWPNASLDTLLDGTTVGRIALKAHGLDLHAFVQLSGFAFPIEGILRGEINAEGPLEGIKSSGKLMLTKATIPLGWTGLALTGVEGEASLDAQTMTLAKLAGQTPLGDFSLSGPIAFKSPLNPQLDLTLKCAQLRVPLFSLDGVEVTAAFGGTISGPGNSPVIRGDAVLQTANLGDAKSGAWHFDPALRSRAVARGGFDATWLWDDAPEGDLPPPFKWTAAPWNAWRFDIGVRNREQSPLGAGGISRVDLRLTGTGAEPILDGAVQFESLPLLTGDCALLAESGTLEWRAGNAIIDARASGWIFDEPFVAHVVGPLARPARFFEFAAPLSVDLIRTKLSASQTTRPSQPPRISLLVPAPLMADTDIYEWPEIIFPPATPSDAVGEPLGPPLPPGAPQ